MTCFLFNGKMILVDAGSLFPDPWMVGISIVIPNPQFWLFQNFELLGYVLTHAHEDHIGALPYFLKHLSKPIYATRWTSEILKRRLMDHAIDASLLELAPGTSVKLGPFDVKFLPVGHSIPDACSLLIKAGDFRVFHSGDFKFDTADTGIPESLRELKEAHLDLFLCDSTNSNKDGVCPTEDSVCDPLRKVIAEAQGNVYIASFSSNLMRFKWLAEICEQLGRKLYVSGTSIKANFELGVKLGLVKENSFRQDSDAETPLTKRSVIFMSGCQGEYRSALARLANNEHRFFKLQDKDSVVFSSRTIPGNEKNVSDLIDKLTRLGATIVTPKDFAGIHVSGHAFGGEVSKLLELAKPKRFVPIHGTYVHQLASCERNPEHKSILVKNGSIIE